MTGARRAGGCRSATAVDPDLSWVFVALGAAAGARAAFAGLTGARGWWATNYGGRPVSLWGGPAYAVGALAAVAADGRTPRRVRAAAVLAGSAAALAGGFDDRYGVGSVRGLRGHARAIARGQLTSGLVKVAGIGAGGLAAALLVGRRPVDGRPVDRRLVDGANPVQLLAGAVVVAASANLANLLDLRPGRAAKAGLGVAGTLLMGGGPGGRVAAAAGGAALGLFPLDLGERLMLGDAGANCLGALLGVAVVADAGTRRLWATLGVLLGLTVAGEAVSFSRVIEATPPLRWLDQLGRPLAHPDRG